MPDDENEDETGVEEEEENESYTVDIEGFVWLTDEGEGYFLTGNEAFRKEVEAQETDNVSDIDDRYSNNWWRRKRGLWYVTGALAFENEDNPPGWDIVAMEPTPDILRKFKDQLTWSKH